MIKSAGNSASKDPSCSLDELLSKAGICGVVQISLHATVFAVSLITMCQTGATFFTLHSPPWKCYQGNTSLSNNNTFCYQHQNNTFFTDMELFNKRCDLSRNEWSYITPRSSYSIVTEFDLVCDRKSEAALIGAVYFIGCTIGAILSGPIGDRWGRKLAIVMSLTLVVGPSIGLYFVISIWQLYSLQFIRGIGTPGCLYVVFVYLSEMSPPQFRSTASTIANLCAFTAFLLTDLLAYLLQDWRLLSLYLGLLASPFLLLFMFLPESPRWLIGIGRKAQAEQIVGKMVKFQEKIEVNIERPKSLDKDGVVYTYLDLINNTKVLKITIRILSLWCVLPVLYYVIGAQSLDYGGSMYINYMWASIPDVPAFFVATYSNNKFGRKKTTLVSCFVSGLFIGAVALVSRASPYWRVIVLCLSAFAKLCCSTGLFALFVWTPELFPTVVRAQGMTMAGSIERLALITVPFFCTFLQGVTLWLPYAVMCLLGVLGALVAYPLAETNRKPTRETFEEYYLGYIPRIDDIGLDNVAVNHD